MTMVSCDAVGVTDDPKGSRPPCAPGFSTQLKELALRYYNCNNSEVTDSLLKHLEQSNMDNVSNGSGAGAGGVMVDKCDSVMSRNA